MPELYAVIAEVTPYNFLSVYTPYSSTSANAYFLPPPTTLVGALAYAYRKSVGDFRELRDDGASPAAELVEQGLVRYAVAGVGEPFTIVNTIERVYQHPYLRKQHWKREEMAYTVAVRQQVFVRKLYILFIIASDSLALYSYAMTRIGRKESLVSVDRVFAAPVKKLVDLSKKSCGTPFYFPLSIAKDYDPKDVWVEVDMPTLAKENFIKKAVTTERFAVPKPFTPTLVKATVELNANGAVLNVNLDGKLLEVPVPRKVLM